MKHNILLLAIVAVMMAACNSDKIRSFIPGTYVNSAGGEYSVADDTLVIESAESNNYNIHRKTGFNVITDSKKVNACMKLKSGRPFMTAAPNP
ncbi:MAG: hypothetical protein ACRDE7_02440 [Sphingobacterium sp.]